MLLYLGACTGYSGTNFRANLQAVRVAKIDDVAIFTGYCYVCLIGAHSMWLCLISGWIFHQLTDRFYSRNTGIIIAVYAKTIDLEF